MNSMLLILAQAATSQPAGEAPWYAKLLSNSFFPLILALFVLMIFMSRGSQKTEEKKRQSMLSTLKKGDKVQTIGGIVGMVHSVDDKEVTLKVDESNNTKMKFTRSAIHKVLESEEAK